MKIQEALSRLLEKRDLSTENMTAVMQQVMTGEATPSQIGGFLIALRMKGETVDEVAAAAHVMRSLADSVSVDAGAIDIVGTGGDSTSTFNISTCCALVAAAAGIKVAKHGNRSVSSKSGAADFLEAAGVNINLDSAGVARCVEQVGVGFMFAPKHHSAMKHAIGPRKEMGVRTVFNLLGPLTNPAGTRRQLLGVYDPMWVKPIAHVLNKLGSEHVLVVHGEGGMDEISLSGSTHVAELNNGQVTEFEINPGLFGIKAQPVDAIRVDGPEESLAMIQTVLANEDGAAKDIVLMNAGAAIYVGGVADSIESGVEHARELLASGAAANKLTELASLSQEIGNE